LRKGWVEYLLAGGVGRFMATDRAKAYPPEWPSGAGHRHGSPTHRKLEGRIEWAGGRKQGRQ